MHKEFLGAVAIVLTFIAFAPYIYSILRGKTVPHVFSWVIWGSTTCIVFFALFTEEGGAGAWPIGLSGLISIYVAVLAYTKKSDNTISKIDWLFFILAMASLPLWYITSDPLWAVVILTTVDVIGFGPTFRKAYIYPYEEKLSFFAIFMVRNLIVIMALEQYSISTVLFPAVIAAASLMLILMVVYRRRTLVENLEKE